MFQIDGENGCAKWLRWKIQWLQILFDPQRQFGNRKNRRNYLPHLEIFKWKNQKEKRNFHLLESQIRRFIRYQFRKLWFRKIRKARSYLHLFIKKYNSPRIRLPMWIWSHVFRLPPHFSFFTGSWSLWRKRIGIWY